MRKRIFQTKCLAEKAIIAAATATTAAAPPIYIFFNHCARAWTETHNFCTQFFYTISLWHGWIEMCTWVWCKMEKNELLCRIMVSVQRILCNQWQNSVKLTIDVATIQCQRQCNTYLKHGNYVLHFVVCTHSISALIYWFYFQFTLNAITHHTLYQISFFFRLDWFLFGNAIESR